MVEGRGARLVAALWFIVLAGCGGSSEDPPAPTFPPPTVPPPTEVGPAGGSVAGPLGAVVFVPEAAVAEGSTVSIRVTAGATLPAPLPSGYTAVGQAFEVTPHGSYFARPVELRVPAPDVTLGAGQRLLLAKVSPGGRWEILSETSLVDGLLTAPVFSFSVVTPVVANAPFRFDDVTLDCGSEPCEQLTASRPNVTLRWNSNRAQVPTPCQAGTAHIAIETVDAISPTSPVTVERQRVAPPFDASGSFSGPIAAAVSRYMVIAAHLRCRLPNSAEDTTFATTFRRLVWPRHPRYPGVAVLSAPATAEVLAGAPADITHVFVGGAGGRVGTEGVPIKAPTSSDRAVGAWFTSRDNGQTWNATGIGIFQDQANPTPLAGESEPWWFWSATFRGSMAEADNNLLVRATACYSPPPATTGPCVDGPATRLVVVGQAVAPTVATTSPNVLVDAGSSASFSATASGVPAPTVKWQTLAPGTTGWVDISGATGTTLTTAPLTLDDNGRQYRMVATNAAGTRNGPALMAAVSNGNVAPSLTAQPAALFVPIGTDAVFAAAARGTAPLTYQWRFNGQPIAGTIGPILRLNAVGSASAGQYSVVVTNAAGSATSSEAALVVTPAIGVITPPTIVTQPTAVMVDVGSTAVLAVGVGGSAPFSYQWFRNGTAIPGATAAFHAIAAASGADAGAYTVQVSNSVGSPVTSSSATLTLRSALEPTPVTLLASPAPQVQPAGGSATFTVGVTGGGPLAFQWLKNGVAIPAATGPQLVLSGLSGADASNYAVTVTNAINSVTSDAASLVVLGAPTITTQPAASTASAGQTATFSVAATGGNLQYQWTRNSVAIPGATAASYTTPVLAASDSGGVYGVVVFNGNGVTVSDPVVLTVTP